VTKGDNTIQYNIKSKASYVSYILFPLIRKKTRYISLEYGNALVSQLTACSFTYLSLNGVEENI